MQTNSNTDNGLHRCQGRTPARCLTFVTWMAWQVLVTSVCAQPSTHGHKSPVELRHDFAQYYRNGQADRAIETGLLLMDRAPKSKEDAFNLAAAYCEVEDHDNALQWLDTAAGNGFSRYSLLLAKGYVTCVHDDPPFEAIRAKVYENYERALVKLREVASRRKPLTIKPPDLNREKAAPLIIALHGYGGTAGDISQSWHQAAADVGAILIAPQGNHRVIGAGFDWDDAREADIIVRGAIERIRKQFKIDARRIVLTGFSQGGYLAFQLAVMNPHLFCGVIPMAGSYTLSPENLSPLSGKSPPRFFIMVGENDSPLESNRRAAADLQAINVPLELRIYPKTGHTLPPNWKKESRDALRFVLRAN